MRNSGVVVHRDRIHLDAHVIARPAFPPPPIMGNVGCAQGKGIDLYPSLEAAATTIHDCLGTKKEYHLQLTGGGTSAMEYLLFHHYLNEMRPLNRYHLISLVTEDAPLLRTLHRMEELGCTTTLAPVDKEGKVDLDALEDLINPSTSLLLLSAVNPLTGVIQPLDAIATLCRARAVKLHLNVNHAVGAWHIKLHTWGVDYASLDGDKCGTTSGIGALLSRNPLGDGVVSPPALLALSEALKNSDDHLEEQTMHLATIRNTFEEELCQLDHECCIIGQSQPRVPSTSCVSFPWLMNEALAYRLYLRGIDVSIGGDPFQSITSMLSLCGHPHERALGAISFGFPRNIREDEVVTALDQIRTTLHDLRRMRP